MGDTHLGFDIIVPVNDDVKAYVLETVAELIPCNMFYKEEFKEYWFCTKHQRDMLECIRILSSSLFNFRCEINTYVGKVEDNLEIGY